MFQTAGKALRNDDIEMMRSLVREDDKIDFLETACLDYLSKIRQRQLTSAESLDHQHLMVSAVAMENLADVIETDIVRLGVQAIQISHGPSEETRRLTYDLYASVENCILLLGPVISEKNPTAAEKILQYERKIKSIQQALMVRKSNRLGSEDEAALKTARIEVSFSDKLVRMYSLIKRISQENFEAEQSPS
jgi:Na+/phosphate symporter